MADAAVGTRTKADWVLANPWFWMALGLGSGLLAYLTKFVVAGPMFRLPFIGLGLLAAGTALWIRLAGEGPAYLERLAPRTAAKILLALVALYLLLACILTGATLARVAGADVIGWRPGHLIVIWFLVVPMSLQAVQNVWLHLRSGAPVTSREEASSLLFLAGLVCFVACRALYAPARPLDWDSIRLVLAVMALVAVVAAPLVVLSSPARRAVVSALLVVHFGGICTAIMAVPPSPWLTNQIWVRIYRPYLEFMYLNNAYHFYAPEPGPSHFLWFRLIYTDAQGVEHGEWVKVPHFNDRTGRHHYSLALSYQRFLALTENTVSTEPMPPPLTADGNLAEFFRRRRLNTEEGAEEWKKKKKDQVVGQEVGPGPGRVLIPFDRFLPQGQQYASPNANVRRLLESFVAHVARYPHPDQPDYKIKSVKVYRIIHAIAQPGAFMHGMEANDPQLHRPYYLGEFNPDGKLKQEQDPFLYWLLPAARDNPTDLSSPIRSWVRKHAGDSQWIWRWDAKDWVEGE